MNRGTLLMADLPSKWQRVRDLVEGGQGHTYIVCCADGSDPQEYVLKRLKNAKREAAFLNEIEAYSSLNHPHILKLIETGRTLKNRLYLLSEYCTGGSLVGHAGFKSPSEGLRFFRKLVDAISHAHTHDRPVYHLDLKPENILLKEGEPVVADFGICFIDDGEVTLTKEGQRGSLHYCAPELRNPKLNDTSRLAAADIYSLGKLLYWLFTQEVYNGHDDDYCAQEHLLFTQNPAFPHFVFIDELIADMVKMDPARRIQSAKELLTRIDDLIRRIDARAHVLDIRIKQHCLYCAVGRYTPAHDLTPVGNIFSNFPTFPNREARKDPPPTPSTSPDDSIYHRLVYVAKMMFGMHNNFGRAAPMFLICDHCGNVQYFRFDYTEDGTGKNWLP